MRTARKSVRWSIVAMAALVCTGCAEAKIGVGPFKALSVEVGPGGVEAKGPSAGPFKSEGVEAEGRGKRGK